MTWTVLPFGKHKGKTLPHIVLKDPDWFFWAVNKGIFKSAALQREAKEISRKAKRIRIPKRFRPGSHVEYTVHPDVNGLSGVEVVPPDRPSHVGSSPTLREDCFDLSFPQQMKSYDKTGGNIIVKAIKFYVFGDSDYRLTRKRCEAFFEDESNFL